MTITQRNIYLAALVAFAAVVSFVCWMGQSIRLDEAQSVWQTSRDLMGVVDTIAKDVHMPLYFIGLHFWEVAFGTSETAIRLFSLLFYLASIPAMFFLAREAYSERVGLFAAFVTAVSPFLSWYGSEARMYSMLFLLSALSHLTFLRLWRHASPSETAGAWWMYGLVAFLGLFTHFFFALVLVSQAVYYFFNRKVFPAGSLRRFGVIAVALAALGGGWMVYRHLAGAGLSDPLLSVPTSFDFFNVFSNFFLGFQPDRLNTVLLSLWPVVVFVGFTFIAKRREREPQTMYLILASVLPIAAAFAVSVALTPVFLSRYLIVALPPLYLVVLHFLSSYKGRVGTAAVSALAFAMVAMLVIQAIEPHSPVKEDYRAAAAYVEENGRASDLFVVSAPFLTYPVEYYYDGDPRLATFPKWERYSKGLVPEPYTPTLISEDSAEWAQVYERVFLLLGYDQGYEEEVRLYMDQHFEREAVETFSPGLTLYVYKLRYL